jgi:hypothetical protein
MRDVGK